MKTCCHRASSFSREINAPPHSGTPHLGCTHQETPPAALQSAQPRRCWTRAPSAVTAGRPWGATRRRRALGQDALEGAPMHAQQACGAADVAIALLEDPLGVF